MSIRIVVNNGAPVPSLKRVPQYDRQGAPIPELGRIPHAHPTRRPNSRRPSFPRGSRAKIKDTGRRSADARRASLFSLRFTASFFAARSLNMVMRCNDGIGGTP